MIDATITVPGSKSITNRALVCAALAEGTSTIRGALVADDTRAMSDCLAGLGAKIAWDGTTVTVTGLNGVVSVDGVTLNANLSGTTSRFILPLLAPAAARSTAMPRCDGGRWGRCSTPSASWAHR